jgi:hypothetical protein
VVAADALDDRLDELLGKAGCDALCGAVALVDEQVEQPVDLGVGEAQLALVCLPDPQVGGGWLGEIAPGRPWARQLARWVVQVADGFRGEPDRRTPSINRMPVLLLVPTAARPPTGPRARSAAAAILPCRAIHLRKRSISRVTISVIEMVSDSPQGINPIGHARADRATRR